MLSGAMPCYRMLCLVRFLRIPAFPIASILAIDADGVSVRRGGGIVGRKGGRWLIVNCTVVYGVV